ncbi:C2H2-type zinc finger protein [Kistimonas scapharcae]|uniref:C2H2-type zinc finger protein n=1 Tax=Kistimonas scapharcae TaxID=1036133 RepID=UPI0031E91354
MERASPPISPLHTSSSALPPNATPPDGEEKPLDLSMNSPTHQLNRCVAETQHHSRAVSTTTSTPILQSGSTISTPQAPTQVSQPESVASTSTQPTASSSTQQSTSPVPQSVAVVGTSGVQSGYSRLEDKRFQCNTCQQLTKTKQHMVFHLRTHTGEKPFKCQHCPKSFSQKPAKVAHERTHTGEKPFKCQHCPKSFSQKPAKVAHERTHTGEKPYKCKLCNYAATQLNGLNYHMRTKHPSQPTTPKDDQPPAKKPKTE